MKRTPFSVSVVIFCTVVFLYKIRLLFQQNFVMDEFVEMYLSKLIHEGFSPFVDFHFEKPLLMSILFSPLFAISNDTFHLLGMARFFMWISNGILLVCIYLVSKNRFNERTALLAVALVLICSTELEQSVKIRTDNISVTLFMISLTLTLAGPPLWWIGFCSGLVVGIAPLVTQKGGIFVIAMLVVWIWRRFFAQDQAPQHFGCSIIGVFLPAFIYLGYIFLFSDIISFYKTAIVGVAGTHLGPEADIYPQFKDFYRIVFFRDPLFWVISIYSLGFGLATVPRFRKETPIFWAAFLISVGFFLFNRPWPYFFVTIIPLLGIIAAWNLEIWVSKNRLARESLVVFLSIPLFFSIGSILRIPKLTVSTNSTQKHVIEVAQDVLEPEHTYFDGVGMLLNRTLADNTNLIKRKIKEFALHPDELDGLIENLVQNQCSLIIYNYRLKQMPKGFQRFVSENYLPVTNIILTSGKIVSFGQGGCQELSLISSGNYKIFSTGEIENFTIDDIPYSVTRHDVPLHSGRHTVCTNKEAKIRVQYIGKGSSRWRKSIPPGMLFFPYTY